ncbi:MAG TPA: AsmA-like C-terminal region-containing protein [Candidatus Acidoferrales bacterium]|nr:AsmA-like C-terminal region-containing protein [Candidatus Acidoferrales bacterium]
MARKATIAALVLLAAGWVALPSFLDRLVTQNRAALRQQIEAAFGRAADFADARFSAWRGFSLTAQNFRVADDPHFAATPLIEAKEIRLPLRWLPLFMGRLEIERLVLSEPEIQIVRDERGRLNLWSSPVAAEARWLAWALEIEKGTIAFVDRSAQEPIEITIQSVDLELSERDGNGWRKLRVAANALPGRAREENLAVEGWVKPPEAGADWTSSPLNLWIRTDGLLITNLVRAVPILRDNLADYLGVVGPVRVQARVRGTFLRPDIQDVKLTGAFFGATKPNVRLTGELHCPGEALCDDPSAKGEIDIDSADLERLRKIPALAPIVPEALSAEGPLTLAAKLAGRLSDLQVNARVEARQSTLRLRPWLVKPKGMPASLELAMAVQKDQTRLDKSLLRLHNLKLYLSGSAERSPRQRIVLHARTDGAELSGWERVLAPIAGYRLRGKTQFDLAVVRAFDAAAPRTTIRGNWSVSGASVHDPKTRRRIDEAAFEMVFDGEEGRIADGSLRVGSTPLKLQAVVRNFSDPLVQYVLRSPQVRVADFIEPPFQSSDQMTGFHAMGEIRSANAGAVVRSALFASSGSWQGVGYRNLSADLVWADGDLGIKRLSLEAMGGRLSVDGRLGLADAKRTALDLAVRVKDLDLKEFFAYGYLTPAYPLEGLLSMDGRFYGSGSNWEELRRSLTGKGKVELRSGTLRNFNLAASVLTNLEGLPGVNLVAAGSAPEKDRILAKTDTVFEALGGAFAIEKEKLTVRSLVWRAEDYTAFGDGWIDRDRHTRWEATLVMSPAFSRIVARERGNARFLLDRSGRLVVPFRIEGTLRRPQIKPDVRRLAEIIRNGLLGREPAPRASTTAAERGKRR